MDKRTVKTYNDIMYDAGEDYNTIHTNSTEHSAGDCRRNDWTLRDLVAEVDYLLYKYTDNGHIYAHETDPHRKKQDNALKTRMRRFIKAHEAEALKTHCINNHCSRFDG